MKKEVIITGCNEHKFCYIRFSRKKPHHSEPIQCIADWDKNGVLIGLEFVDGLEGI